MHTLLALVLATAAAVVIARPPVPVVTTASHDEPPPHSSPTRKYLKDYLFPRYLWPHYFSQEQEETPRQPALPRHHPPMSPDDWLNQEIERLSRMHHRVSESYTEPHRMPQEPGVIKRIFAPNPYRIQNHIQPYYMNQPWPAQNLFSEKSAQNIAQATSKLSKNTNMPIPKPKNKNMQIAFALTPLEEGYFEPTEKEKYSANMMTNGVHEGGDKNDQKVIHENGYQSAKDAEIELEPPRQIRQNPNLSRAKNLISSDIGSLRTGLSNKEYRFPVSLLPSNLRWLKQSRPNEIDQSQEETKTTDETGQVQVMDSVMANTTGSFYGVVMISAIGAAVVMAFLGFAFAWYTLSKRAKAAADVDYPAYGVTGPTNDSSGDRKLAHSAHMYHYQHQKQQIIAMERNGMEERNGSVSDPESDDENEEGDYTVYECPGFATTGDMEVKNPLFNEEPTPATPGKCEVVKPQPQD